RAWNSRCPWLWPSSACHRRWTGASYMRKLLPTSCTRITGTSAPAPAAAVSSEDIGEASAHATEEKQRKQCQDGGADGIQAQGCPVGHASPDHHLAGLVDDRGQRVGVEDPAVVFRQRSNRDDRRGQEQHRGG